MKSWCVIMVCVWISVGCRDDGSDGASGTSQSENQGSEYADPGGTGASPADLDETFEGVATYYDADGSGACMFDADPSDIHVAALTKEQWASAGWCGACADATGPDGTVRVRIVDQCPGCKHGHLDMHPEAFDQIAARRLGIVDITWQFVSCDVQGPLRYKYKDGSNPWWTAVQVRNHRRPILSLEWSADGATWNTTVRQDYNYFLAAGGFGEGAVEIRVTSIDGQVIQDKLPPVESELEVQGTDQF